MLEEFIRAHRLPDAFTATANRWYLPLAEWVESRLVANAGETFVLGINGAQGTGKSTLADLLHDYLTDKYQRRVALLSIDDIYLTRAERSVLAKNAHPLLRTRGVPGTHDVELGVAVINRLRELGSNESCRLPRFDKSQDDRCPEQNWPTVTGPVDLVIFEGWCVGSRAADPADLAEPVNELERLEDTDGDWRRYVNDKLSDEYAPLFSLLDGLLFLRAPSFAAVQRWRLEQEHNLKARTAGAAVMDDAEVARFIQHYQRITENNLAALPALADGVIELGEDHQPVAVTGIESIRGLT